MEEIGQYMLRLTAAALVCSIATVLAGKKGSLGAVIKLLAGVYLTLNIVSPWMQVRWLELTDLTEGFSAAANDVGLEGQNAAREAMAESITQKTSAYILDKAGSFGAELTVEVILDTSAIPVPCGVRISGSISPYGKRVLSSMIEEELGIPTEEQIWI